METLSIALQASANAVSPKPSLLQPDMRGLRALIYDRPLESLVLVLAVFGALTALLAVLLVVKNRRARKVDRLLYSDELTRLLNFRKFRIEASLLLNAPKRPAYTMLYLNVNDFKYINDTFGYAAGDGVLRSLSELIGRRIASNELFTRLQGDRFVALLKRDTRADVESRVDAIFRDLDAFNERSDLTCNVTVSLGAYDIPDGELDVNASIDRANYARSQVTQRHASECVYYSDAFRNRIRREKEMERVMNDALADGQFLVYYQPKVDCVANRLAGAEALVRWLHPERGLIPPSEFIPLFEKNGFIVKVDLFVFEEVCKWLQARIRAKLPTCVISSNFSRLHLADDDFPERLRRIADQYGVPHGLLEVEITETVALGYSEQAKKHLERLHTLGFGISIDDFGSGYSSLGILSEYPVNVLKLDKTFVRDTFTDKDRVILSGIVDMAHALGVHVVCEGVETEQQLEELRKARCRVIQGYYYSKPLPESAFARYIERLEQSAGA